VEALIAVALAAHQKFGKSAAASVPYAPSERPDARFEKLRTAAIKSAAEIVRLAGGVDDYDLDTGESGMGSARAESLRIIALKLRDAALPLVGASPQERATNG
jgi:hypothetical protein